MKRLVKTGVDYEVWHHKGVTRFKGCQCIKDCTCYEDFKSSVYDFYTVKRTGKNKKTTTHNYLFDVEERIKLLDSIITQNKQQ